MKNTFRACVIVGATVFGSSAFAGCPLNINGADAAEIARCLDGVGDKTAAAIVEYREQHGDFKSVEDLVKVKGVGDKTLEKNKENLRLAD